MPTELIPSDPTRRVVKDYVYVSRRKVEKFYAQIPKSLSRRIVAKLTLGLPPHGLNWLPLKLELGKRPVEENLYFKLAVILKHIKDESGIGTIDQPTKYFAGEIPLFWGPYGAYWAKPGLVFFGGMTRTTVLGLGGSLEHVIGAKPRGKMDSRSDTPWLVDALLWNERRKRLFPNPQHSRERRMDRELQLQAVEVAVRETEERRQPAELMEFVAIRLAEDSVSGEWAPPWAKKEHKTQRQVLLGSPIYVARV